MRLASLLLIAVTLAAGCAGTGPGFDTEGVSRDLEPRQAARDGITDRRVLWGGTILATVPQEETTQVEILAYPLDRGERPLTDRDSRGRFLAVTDGFLEPADYAEGREVTVVGTLDQTQTATIGEAEYHYPVVDTETIHLWPRETARRSEPRVHFGIGIGIIN
ncbi:Slp family lipoprotein [Aquisalimonas lutea]|uniref:Slp family lipoprotein n=1 Tax=Aquisalimonas lutea TaxID=1327750 RepID=UPI0025B4A788|nr:Slp family lipoprotein [Aquisalimonas lutea]MDN3516953.1 Slp family lipoprotein [Aquisalimonas lutea]